MCGILPFDSGEVYIDGISLKEHPREAKLKLAYISDNHAVFERLTGREYVNHIANLYNTPAEDRDAIVTNLLDVFNLTNAYDKQIKSYSHGMKQKINVIAGLVHNPKLWVLDEPLLGLDPQSGIELNVSIKVNDEDYTLNDNIVIERGTEEQKYTANVVISFSLEDVASLIDNSFSLDLNFADAVA